MSTDTRLADAPSLPDHQGSPQAATARPPLVPPPPQIGTVRSVDTAWRRGTLGGPAGIAVTVVLALVLVPVVIFLPVMAMDTAHNGTAVRRRGNGPPPPPSPLWLALAVVADAALVGGAGWMLARQFRARPATSYVGTDGIATFAGNGRGEVTRSQVLAFADAADLFTGGTRHYYNGVYTGTSYTFKWTDPAGRSLLRLAGRHNSKAGTPKAGHPFWFGRAAELAWSNQRWARCLADLDRQRYVEFRVNAKDYVRVGHGIMEFGFGNRVERLAVADVASVSLKDGAFHVSAKDAKWFSRAGKFHFTYVRMANARVFLFALDRLVGLRFN